MVDRNERHNLACALENLAEGEMTTDDFSTLHGYSESKDPAISEIYRYGCSLFHDIYPYKLKGPNQLDKNHTEAIGRCLLFLSTDLEYRWPSFPTFSKYHRLMILAGLFAFFGYLTVAHVSQVIGAVAFGLGFITIILTWLMMRRREAVFLKEFWKAGEKDAWPFLSIIEKNSKAT